MSVTQDTTTAVQSDRLVGQVKCFNNKAGYGFITVSDGDYSGKDIFVHYSTISVTNSQYKYLLQGEYVEFTLSKSSGETHEYQAGGVTGIKGGLLMCETRRSTRPVGDRPASDRPAGDRPAPTYRKYRKEGDAPASEKPDADGDFTTVRKNKRPRPAVRKPKTDNATPAAP